MAVELELGAVQLQSVEVLSNYMHLRPSLFLGVTFRDKPGLVV
jgi:hypothetical protein